MSHQWVVPLEKGSAESQPLLGGKGAGLAQMWQLGIPTLPGFVVTTEAWRSHKPGSRSLVPELWREVKAALKRFEEKSGKTFGSSSDPLIVSVRSSPLVSMPGQLKTVLNVGLVGEAVAAVADAAASPRFTLGVFARLVQMYGETVHGLTRDLLTRPVEASSQLPELVDDLLAEFRKETGEEFPQDPYVQLERTIAAVFDSWYSGHAGEYRVFHRIPEQQGTAVIVQQMAFGNLDANSGSGVVFTRNPVTGQKELYGEYLPGGQGEQLVGGQVTPESISDLARELPRNYAELEAFCSQLEEFYRDVLDVEFTIERGKLWILQTRPAKRAPAATIKAAVDLASEGLISREEAVERVHPALLDKLFRSAVADGESRDVLAQGIQSSPGAAAGRVAFDSSQVRAMAAMGQPVILVTEETSADDAAILPLVSGVLTQHGGATCHAAVVARGLGIPSVVGCGTMEIGAEEGVLRFGDVTMAQGDEITIDGAAGRVYRGRLDLAAGGSLESGELNTLLSWADEMAQVHVLADAGTPAEIEAAVSSGAEGVGLCRTERLYFDFPFLPLVRELLLRDSSVAREQALGELLLLHQNEYKALLQSAGGRRLTVRLLNAAVALLLPDRDALLTELAELRLVSDWSEEIGRGEQMLRVLDSWRHSEPGVGLRGARLAVALPRFVEAQVEALLRGVFGVLNEGLPTDLGILIPFVTDAAEVESVSQLVHDVARRVMDGEARTIKYQVGASIETPRAALLAGELAPLVDFLCVDTDVLTDTVFCLSRENGGWLLPPHLTESLSPDHSSTALDREGVGALIRLAVERARSARADIEIRVCGRHGQDPAAIPLYDDLLINAVVCHPSQLLGARLMVGQAAVRERVARRRA